MTPKEKSKRLIRMFIDIGVDIHTAKVYVEIMIDGIALITDGHHKDAIQTPFIEYWQDVKQKVSTTNERPIKMA